MAHEIGDRVGGQRDLALDGQRLPPDCDQPKQVKDFKFSGDGTMKLSQDRSASLDMDMKGLTRSELRIDTKLGNRPSPAPGGTAMLRVISTRQLQAIWSLPNNDIVVTMKASPTTCTILLAVSRSWHR